MALAAIVPLLTTGCFRQELQSPFVVYAPYPAQYDLVFAVAPLRNESGVSEVDELAITDQLVAQVEQIEGVRAVPVNRTIIAMEALGIPEVITPAEARQLALSMEVDAIVVGTIEHYDPYNPPQFAMNIALFAGKARGGAAEFDPSRLVRAASDQRPGVGLMPQTNVALSSVSAHFDATNHLVRSRVQRYAHGRFEKNAPMGWERFLMSMERYQEFCTFALIEALMEAEKQRLANAARPQQRTR